LDYTQALRDFSKAVFNKTGFWPADIDQTFIPENETAKLRAHLIREEANEASDVLEGVGDNISKAHLLKELCDVIYVVFYAAVAYNLPIEEAFKRVHENNMEKITKGTIGENGKLIKPPNHQKVYLKDLTGEDKQLVPVS
jgi:NTP pyrophosphatase (non-canonical NTP hydrolase)